MATKIEVEWIAQSQQMNSTLERINKKLDDQDKKLEQISKTSKKAADAAAGSFSALQKELKAAEDKLKGMAKGTAEFEKQRKEVERLKSAVGNASAAMSSQQATLTGKITANIGQMMTGFFTIGKVVEAISFELQKSSQLKLRSAVEMKTFEQALADLAQNIPASDLKGARSMIQQNAGPLGTTQEGLANLLGVGISAGAKDLKEALALSSAALKLTGGDAQKAVPLVGSTLDIASLSGSTNFEGATGQLLQTQSQVRSTNLPEFGANIGPGLAAAMLPKEMMKGVSSEVALETAAVISQVIKDQTGSNTATSMRMFFTRLGSFVPESKMKIDGRDVGVDKATIDKFAQTDTFEGRLAMMRQDKNLADQFLETQRESIGKIAITSIVRGQDPIVMEMERKAQAAISNLNEAQTEFNKRVAAITEETPVLAAERKNQANQQALFGTNEAGLIGQSTKIVKETLASIDLSGSDWLNDWRLQTNMKLYREQGMQEIDAAVAVLREAKLTNFGMGEVSQADQSFIDRQISVLEELSRQLELMRRENANPRKVIVAPAAVRPQEAPLPAATVP